jgi:hypothetical protein
MRAGGHPALEQVAVVTRKYLIISVCPKNPISRCFSPLAVVR